MFQRMRIVHRVYKMNNGKKAEKEKKVQEYVTGKGKEEKKGIMVNKVTLVIRLTRKLGGREKMDDNHHVGFCPNCSVLSLSLLSLTFFFHLIPCFSLLS